MSCVVTMAEIYHMMCDKVAAKPIALDNWYKLIKSLKDKEILCSSI